MSQIRASTELILFNQLSGISEALKNIIQSNGTITKSTIDYAQQLKEFYLKKASGKPLNILPEINHNSTGSDILVLICTMRNALETMLSEEERNSIFNRSAKWIGLANKAKDLLQ